MVATATNDNGVTTSATSLATSAVLDAAPTITTPTIAGTAEEGDTLTASASSGQSDNPVTYQWEENSGQNGAFVAIANATGSTYQVQEGDEGFQIEVVATATNDNGVTISATSFATSAVLDAAPTITTPTIAGTAEEGDTLTASASSGQSDNPVTYQWEENSGPNGAFVAIANATGSTYQVQESDEGFQIEVVATATNDNGVTISAMSAATAAVLDAAPTITTPTIAGTAEEGDTLTASASSGQSDNPVTYQWEENSGQNGAFVAIANATGSTYQVQEGDEGFQIEVVATATNDNGVTISATSLATSAVLDAAPTITTPTIAGAAEEGDTLTASASSGQSDNPVTYQWEENSGPNGSFVAIANATGSTYQVQESDEGFQIEVVATATNDNGVTISATSSATSAVLDAAPTVTTPTIAGTAEEGDTLTASASSGQSDNPVTYQWEENSGQNGSFVAIANATGSTYQVQESDEGFQIEVVATATNDNGVTISATSFATSAVLDAAPTITTPTIAGTAEEGDTLTASASSGQSDNPVTYQWEENSGPNGAYVAIVNATGSTYQVQEGDEGFQIEVVATATNDNGVTISATSAATAAVLDAAPTITTPTIAGTAEEGDTLTASASSGQSDNTVTYQWEENSGPNGAFVAIANATGSTYQVQESDEGFQIEVVATATNDNGVTISATSFATSAVLDAAPTITTPTIAGTAEEGDTLTASASSGQSDNPVTYQWEENSGPNGAFVAIANATGSTYQVQESDEGFQIEVVATATNDNGVTISATSLATSAVLDAAPTITTPTIAGTAEEGDTLTASASSGQSDNPVTYQWEENSGPNGAFVAIANATGSTYQVQQSDEGFQIEVVATATNDNGVTISATSAATAAVLDAAPTITTPTIAGTAEEGDTLTASASSGQSDNPVTYQWEENSGQNGSFVAIANATGSTYQVQESDEGFQIEVVATATNDNGVTISATSLATSAVLDAAPTITTPTIAGTAEEGDTLTASASSGQSDNTVTYQWEENSGPNGAFVAVANATGSTYQVQESDEGFQIEVVATATNDNGVTTSATSTATSAVPFGGLTDEWLNTAGGSWTDTVNAPTNWSDGALPRSIDTALIDQAGSGAYTVTIPSGASATAAALTLNSSNATLSDLGTLTLNGILTIDAGTFKVSGSGSLSGETSIGNAGTIEAVSGATLQIDVGVSNSGAIEDFSTLALSGETLTNTGAGAVTVETSGSILDLESATVSGGTIADTVDGTINVSGTSTLENGATLKGGGIADSGTLDISGTVTVENGAEITGGALSIGAGATFDAETASGAILNDVDVTVATGGTLQVDPITSGSLVPLTLEGGTTVTGGTLVINSGGEAIIASGGATLDDVTVTNNKTLLINSGTTLTLDGGTVISGSTITDNGTIDVTGAATINGGANLTGGHVTVESGQTLTLDGATLTNTTVNDIGTLNIDANNTLTLSGASGVTIDGSTSSNGTVDNSGTVALGSSTLTLLSGGFLTLDDGGKLTLSGGTISGTGGATLENAGNTISGFGAIGIGNPNTLNLDNDSGGTIEALGGTLTIKINSAISNAGTLEAATAATLKITVGAVDNTGNIQVDGTLAADQPTANGGKLTLNDGGTVTLAGGTIDSDVSGNQLKNNGNVISGHGQIGDGNDTNLTLNNASGTVEASGGFLTLETGNTVLNAGTLEAASGSTLQIDDGVTNQSGGSITVLGGGTVVLNGVTVGNSGAIALDAGSLGSFTTLFVEGTTVTLDGTGSVTLATDSQIISNLHAVTLDNAGNDISGAGLFGDSDITLDNDLGATIDATGFLSLGAGTTNNSGLLEATTGGTLQLENSVSNSGTIEADGGTLDVFASASITGNAIVITAGGVLDFAGGAATNVSFSGSGTLQLAEPQAFSGTIAGFATGDVIELPGASFQPGEYAVWTQTTTANGGSGTLQIDSGSGTPIETFQLAGIYTSAEFVPASASPTGTEIAFADLWTSNSSGDWFTAGDWTAGVPGPTTYAVIDQPVTVTMDSAGSFAQVAADSGATLLVQSITLNNAGGVILASGGTVDLQSAHINGGTFESSNGGAVDVLTGTQSVLDGTGNSAVANAGTLNVDDGATLLVVGPLDNSGTITLDSSGDATTLLFHQTVVTLSGGGVVAMTDNANNAVQGSDGNGDTLNNVDNTIEGAGSIDGGIALTNEQGGVIDATGTNQLVIDLGTTVVNDGTLEATNPGALSSTGGLLIENTRVNGAGGGTISAAGGAVALQGADIIGGSLETTSGHIIQVSGDAQSTFDGTSGTVDNTGSLQIEDGATLLVLGPLDNSGTIALDSSGDGTTLLFHQTVVTLSGGGVISMTDNANNAIQGFDGNSDTLTNVDNTIEGAGAIDGGIALTNEQSGVIDATGANALIINLGTTVINDGTLEASNPHGLAQSGGLLIQNTHVNGTGGGVILADGTHVDLQNADIIGGTLQSSSGGVINVLTGAQSTLDGTNGALDNTGALHVGDGATLLLLGSIDNSGTIALESGGDATTLLFHQAGVTLSGGGVVSMTDNANNAIQGFDGSGDTLTNVDNTIEGAGSIDGGITLINEQQGVIDATGTNALVIDLGATVTNEGKLEATSGGTLQIDSGIDNTGTLEANGGTLIVESVVNTSGGTVAIAGGGTANFESFFDENVTFSGSGGTLIQSHPGSFDPTNGTGSTISGFATGDTLDLQGYNAQSGDSFTVSATFDSGSDTTTLTVTDPTVSNSDTQSIILAGDYSTATLAAAGFGWSATPDGTGGVNVTEQPVTAHWAGASADDWTTPGDWTDGNGNVVPIPNDLNNVIIDQTGTYTLTITGADTANSVIISANGAGADVQDETGGSLSITEALTIDAGSFSLIGGSLTAASIYVGAAGHFNAEGTVQAPLDNDGGTVEALGNLSLAGAVSGAGTFQIDTGNTLDFGSSVASGATVAFAPLSFQTVDHPDETGTALLAISNSGEIVGSDYGGGQVNGMTLTNGQFTEFQAFSDSITDAYGVNSAGDIVGAYDAAGHAFEDIGGTITNIDPIVLGASSGGGSGATGINDSGVIVGVYNNDSFELSGGVYTTIALPNSPFVTQVQAIDDNGDIAGNFSPDGGTYYGFVLTAGGQLETLSIPDSHVEGINDSGDFVGYIGEPNDREGFLDVGGIIYTVNVPDATRTQFSGINDSGEIVGYYYDQSGVQHGFTTTVQAITEPGTIELNNSSAFSSQVANFGAGAVIDLTDIAFSATMTAIWNAGSGQLTIDGQTFTGGQLTPQTDTIAFANSGAYGQSSFALTVDSGAASPQGEPGTEIIFSPAQVAVTGQDIGDGNAVEGQVLTVTLTSYSGVALSNVNYTWLDNGQVVSGNDTDTYTPQNDVGNAIDVIVSFNDPVTGATDEITAPIGSVEASNGPSIDTWTGTGDWINDAAADWSLGAPPSNGAQATISSGQAEINSNLTLDGNTIENNAEIDIGVATGAILTLTDGTAISEGRLIIEADSTLEIANNATLTLPPLTNHGTLQVDANATLILGNDLALNGGGNVTMASGSVIDNLQPGSTQELDNSDNTISGVGTIGGNGGLTLVNEAAGTVDATGGTLTLDTGNTVTNHGLLEATNSGTLDVQDATIDNTGIGPAAGIVIDGSSTLLIDGNNPQFVGNEIIANTVQLTGGGDLTLEGGTIAENADDGLVTSSGAILVLDNVDNTISGSGLIGNFDGSLVLTNESSGTIDANVSGSQLSLDTGNTIENAGTLEASSGGYLLIHDTVDDTGNGELLADGGTIEIGGAVIGNEVAAFGADGGTFLIDHPDPITGFFATGGTISGFDADSTAAAATVVDLDNLGFGPSHSAYTYALWDNASNNLQVFTVNGQSPSSPTDVNFTGTYNQNSFALRNDGSGGTAIIASPATLSFLAGLDGNGDAVEGQQITVELAPVVADASLGTVSYAWFDDGVLVQGDTTSSFTPTGDAGDQISVVASFTDPNDGVSVDYLTADAGLVQVPAPDTWNGTGDWINDAAADWSSGAPPNPGDAVNVVSGHAQINADVTLNDNAVQNSAEIDIGVTSGAILTLDGGASISGGTLVLGDGASGTLRIDTGATLTGGIEIGNDGTDFGTIEVTTGTTLTLDNATINGHIYIGDIGEVDVTGSSTIEGDAWLAVGATRVEAGQTLTLDGDLVTSNTITVGGQFADVTDPSADPPASSTSNVFLTGINSSGQAVGDYIDGHDDVHGFIYDISTGQYTALDDVTGGAFYPGFGTYPDGTLATGINNSGNVVGSFTDSGGVSHGFIYTAGGHPAFTTVDAPGAAATSLDGINNSNEVFGTYSASGVTSYFTENTDGSGFTPLSNLPTGTNVTVFAINDSGSLLGTYNDSAGNVHSFVYTSGATAEIIDPNAEYLPSVSPGESTGTQASAINNAGVVAGTFFDTNGVAHGFVATPSGNSYTYITLDDPQAVFATDVYGINNNGQVLGQYSDGSNVAHGFIYDIATQTYTNFSDPSAVTDQQSDGTYTNNYGANGINDNGEVIGSYSSNDEGGYVPFLYNPAAAASTLSLDDGALIAGNTLILGGNDTLDIELGGSGGNGATLDGVTMTNNGAIEVDLSASGAILTLDDSTTITGGTLNIEHGHSAVDITLGSHGGNGATLSDVAVTSAGTIAVDPSASGAILTLDDGTSITGGNLTVGHLGTLDIGAAGGGVIGDPTLDGVTVTLDVSGSTAGTIAVDPSDLGEILTLDDNTKISGGKLTVSSAGVVDIVMGSAGQGSGATLDDVTVTDGNAINVDPTASGAVLTLDDGTTITGGTLSIGTAGELVVGSNLNDNGATLYETGIDNAGTISIDAGTTLGLLADSLNKTVTLQDGGTVSMAAGSELAGIAGTGNGQKVTLDNVDNTISGAGTLGSVGNVEFTIKNEASGTIDANVSGQTLDLETGTPIQNFGVIEATNGGILRNDSGISSETGSSIRIGTGGTVIDTDPDPASNVIFAGIGTLEWTRLLSYSGTISGFGSGDAIDLADFGYAAHNYYSFSSGALTVSSVGGASEAPIAFSGTYGQESFALQNDGAGNTEVIADPATLTVSGVDGNDNPAEGQAITVTLSGQSLNDVTYTWIDGGVVSSDTSNTFTPTADADNQIIGLVSFDDPNNPSTVDTVTAVLGKVQPETNTWIGTGDWVNDAAADWSTGATPNNGDQVIIASGQVEVSSSVTLDNIVLQNDGEIDATSGGTLTLVNGSVTNAGTLEASSGGELSIQSTVDNSSGSVLASGGFVDFLFGISGGSATISSGGTLEYGWSSDVATSFTGSGTLVLDHQDQSDLNFATASYTGTVSGFGSGDVFDLTDLFFVPASETLTWSQNSGILAVSNGTDTADINLAGNYTPNEFALEQTASGNTAVVFVDTSVPILQGATYELSIASSENVSFNGNTGTFIVDNPATFAGTIAGISGSGDILDLRGLDAVSTDSFAASAPVFSGGDTVLTVTDTTQGTSESVTLVGDYTSDNNVSWSAPVFDGHGGASVFDPPANGFGDSAIAIGEIPISPIQSEPGALLVVGANVPVTVSSGGSTTITVPFSDGVTFTGGTGSLVLNDPAGFTGQIVGFTGTAPDVAHSDTIDLVGINYNSAHFAECIIPLPA